MKRNVKITLSGIVVALSVVVMFLSYFPYLTYAVPAVTGLFMMMLVIEIDSKWAALAYVATALIVFMIAEPESKLLYIFLFGYYPILKSLIERVNKPVLEWILKIFVFNLSVLIVYLIFSNVFDISVEDFKTIGRYSVYIFLLVANFAFVIYDIAVSRMAVFYMRMLHPKISKIFKLNR